MLFMDKKKKRLKRAEQTRRKIRESGKYCLSVFRSNLHIYASIFSVEKDKVLVSSSTLDPEVRSKFSNKKQTSNQNAASIVGTIIAERSISIGIDSVAFDRSGFSYHGRIKALADSARCAGLKF